MSTKAHREYCALLRLAAGKLGQAANDAACARPRKLILRLHDHLARPPRITVFGEVNSGKSSLANLLIGESVVPTSVVANSHFPIRFHYAAEPSLGAIFSGGGRRALPWSEIDHLARLPVERVEVGLPLERLRMFEVVDTPGIGNPLLEGHRFEAQRSLAHLPIWCTVAARAWKESERKEWVRLSGSRSARGMLCVTQIDLLPDRSDLEKVLIRLQNDTAGLFRAIVPLDGPAALASSVIGSETRLQNLWADSGGALLERTITGALAEIAELRVASAKRLLLRSILREQSPTMPNGPRRELALRTYAGAERSLGSLASKLGSDVLDALIPSRMSETTEPPPLVTTLGMSGDGGEAPSHRMSATRNGVA